MATPPKLNLMRKLLIFLMHCGKKRQVPSIYLYTVLAVRATLLVRVNATCSL